jgi:molecular chaperone DnaK
MHEVKKDLEEFRAELTETEIADIEKVIADVDAARRGEDVAAIKAELEKAVPAMAVLLQKRQAKEQPQTQTQDAPVDDVVDATFTETKA